MALLSRVAAAAHRLIAGLGQPPPASRNPPDGRPGLWQARPPLVPAKALFWMIVPLLGAVELGAHLFFSTRAPDLAQWRGVRPTIEKLHREGDLIVAAPEWAEPNARHAFGDALMPFEHVARADETTFTRAIEVGILDAHVPELTGWREVAAERSGKFWVRVLENPAPAAVVFDFVAAAAGASVQDLVRGSEEACPWRDDARRSAGGLHGHPAFPAARHVCPGGEWHFVGVTAVEDERWRGRRCLWAHPTDAKTLSIRYTDVPLGRRIRGYGTLPYWVEREKKGPDVVLEALVNGKSVGRYVHHDGSPWAPFSFETGLGGQLGDVEFRISTKRAKDRQFCFVADTR